ncbi:phosphate/phosphite/phosphonate ABC transporter substrate-binding protein [Ramlibacter algicola]|uniref:PhnD/SsuA/transferrin family substrate-binding protein n=1 Tax=Ramlibacter algicola TaxID=2795217 RepID=A0A934Q423_9BURK|nr:PhnD/SsuA/transferrin family substrate-binding protein [Ramlibacter algicola]MBK0394798.1 PhnD/SsuA/transferrin family substrate-binding protein [Ramlibacter algicola]
MQSTKVTRRDLIAAAGLAGLAQALPVRAEGGLVFAVNEGVTYATSTKPLAERFHDVQEDLQKLLKRPVRVVGVPDYKQLVAGLGAQQFDIAWVHPAHHAIRALKGGGYHLVGLTKGYTEYRASFLVAGTNTLKSVTDLRAARVGAPDEDSVTSVIARATLREALGGQLPQITYVRYQDAVPFMVEHGMADSGVTASGAVVKSWQDKGGKVLARSKPVPIKQLLASSKAVNGTQLAQLRSYFAGLATTESGKKRLEPLGVQGFEEFDEQVLAGIGGWLGV